MKLFRKSEKYRDRMIKINEILDDLEVLKGVKDREINQYAVEENILFFKSARLVFSYIWWLLFHAPKIDGERLLEVTDFGVEKWDREMHTKLIEMEKKKFPGLVAPLVKKISSFISNGNGRQLVVSLGAGGMEVERQVIAHLIDNKHKHPVVFVGVDRSETAQEIAQENLRDLIDKGVVVKKIDYINEDIINKELNNLGSSQHLVIICRNDIFELDNDFSVDYFDLVFHTLFKHHLDKEESRKIDTVTQKVAKHTMEYDGYRSWGQMIPQTIVGWNNPVFLNAEIFSNIRFAKKRAIRENNSDDQYKLSFYPLGYYIKEYKW